MAYEDFYELPDGVTDADELKAERGRFFKVYEKPGSGGAVKVLRTHAGTGEREVAGGIQYFDQHDQDGTGKRWRETDTEVVLVNGRYTFKGIFADYLPSVARRANQSSTFKSYFYDRGPDHDAYDEIGISIPGSNARAELEPSAEEYTAFPNRSVGFPNTFGPNTRTRFVFQNWGLEHVTEFHSYPTGTDDVELEYELQVPAGYEVFVGSSKLDRQASKRGHDTCWIGRPGAPRDEWIRLSHAFVWDTEKQNPDGSVAIQASPRRAIDVRYELKADGNVRMTKIVPRSYFDQALRKGTFPVVTDALISPQAPTDDDSIEVTDAADWDTAHDATTGDSVRGGNLAYIREQDGTNVADVWRSFSRYDCTAIGSGQAVSDVISYHQRNSYTDGGAEIDACPATGPTGAPTTADFDACTVNGSDVFASMDIGVWIAHANNSYVDFTWNSTGHAHIEMVSGDTLICYRMNGDVDDVAPGTASQVRHWTSNASGREQYLDVTYSSAGYTLTAESGTTTVAGTAAGLEHDRSLSAAAGATTAAGTDAGLEHDRRLDAESGAVAAAGTDAAFPRTRRLDAESGAAAAAGTDAGLDHDRVLSAESGATAAAGADVGLLKGLTLDAQPGSAVAAGTAAGLDHDRVLGAEAGATALAGQDAGLLHGYLLDAGVGAVVAAGVAAALQHDRVLTADAGAVSAEGADANLTKTGSHTLDAESGAVGVAGVAASLLHDKVLGAGAGAVVVLGTDADLSKQSSLVLDAEAGATAVAGTPAGLEHGRKLAADTGAVALAGADAALLHDQLLNALPGATVISPTDAGLQHHRLLDAEAGAVGVTPQDAALYWHRRLNAEPGSVVVVGTGAILTWSGEIVLVARPGERLTAVAVESATYLVLSPSGTSIVIDNTATEIS